VKFIFGGSPGAKVMTKKTTAASKIRRHNQEQTDIFADVFRPSKQDNLEAKMSIHSAKSSQTDTQLKQGKQAL